MIGADLSPTADPAAAEGRVWAQRLLAFYQRSTALAPDERETLAGLVQEAVAASVRAGHPVRRWPVGVNAALDAWEAQSGKSGPRVAHFDLARGVITKAD